MLKAKNAYKKNKPLRNLNKPNLEGEFLKENHNKNLAKLEDLEDLDNLEELEIEGLED